MLRPAHILQLAVMAMLGFAVIMVHSAGMQIGSSITGGVVADAATSGAASGAASGATSGASGGGPRGLGDTLTALFLSRHTIYAILAVGAMFLASRLDVRSLYKVRGWANPLVWALLASLVLTTLTLVPGLPYIRTVNGASRWLQFGPVSFQPSELVKWTMVLTIAWWCAHRQGVMHRFRHGLLPMLLLLGFAGGMIIIEDLGTGALIGLVAACLLLAGGAKWWHLAATIPPAAAGLVLAIMHSPYRLARLTAFLDPWADPRGTGYHPIQSMLAIAQGGLTGRGLGNGIQKFGYLPEDTSDFIFAIICEELGVSGALLVVIGYLVILWVGMGIVRDCRDSFGRLLGLGMLLTVGFQAVINLAVVTVVVPTKGIALPLLSAGGTGWIMTAFCIGLVASLDEANTIENESAAAPPVETAPLRLSGAMDAA